MAKKTGGKDKVVFIVGPTGAGKSAFGVKLARKLGGEIISCDSMQVYEGMRIMSQQPADEELAAAPHHLIGVLSPAKEYSAARFMNKAKRLIKEIHRRGKIPILVGGSGLYAKALIDGLFPSPPKDEKFRKRLYAYAKRHGKERLHERLEEIDPVYAAKVHPNDLKKVVRGLEVHHFTKRPVSEMREETKGISGLYDVLIFGMDVPRQRLYERINARVDVMFGQGLVDEVRRLSKKKVSMTASAALGYKEIKAYLKGECDLKRAKELLKRNTRRYAKRQLTWFRADKRIIWVNPDGKSDINNGKVHEDKG